MTATNSVDYLLSLPSIRETAQKILACAERDGLKAFEFHAEKMPEVADYVYSVIRRDFEGKYGSIPPHGRWQHFEVGGVPRLTQLVETWQQSKSLSALDVCKRVIDVTFVSVLLDAGAGNVWRYVDNGAEYGRSEGIAVASLRCFEAGLFSSDSENPLQVDGVGLEGLTVETLGAGMQVTEDNLIEGLQGRVAILNNLGKSLGKGRPSDILDRLECTSSGATLDVANLWTELQQLLLPIWPERTVVGGRNLGDAWYSSTIQEIQPFHKLTQWLAYSLLIPLRRILQLEVCGEEQLTGLPEYRNGGLFVDLGVLRLRSTYSPIAVYAPNSDVIVEWRAMTVVLLDALLPLVNEKLAAEGAAPLTLAQMLEAGSWKSGRLLAAKNRKGGGSPILIQSDGTLF
ncbi:DUF1688 family protein [Schizosaccharomyces japonicus yFS275]|uniref:DUF1688 family protein n=1 Tax=Schizosaccharomyces japonicus (strain yFS275 / FY16936) TaxID=402676 RepID=B6K7J6_SCHJY|nr:DUF1688 family protein [Schizosaccharomyces japonicus yFS275]EEB09500.1 DUF1688 family protein [Schizosaccharomyces japonicus yFS275]